MENEFAWNAEICMYNQNEKCLNIWERETLKSQRTVNKHPASLILDSDFNSDSLRMLENFPLEISFMLIEI